MQMNVLEAVGALAGAVSVYLSARENIWNWPIAIVNLAVYVIVFEHTGLYSDMGLQVVFLVLSVYGWYAWLHGGGNQREFTVRHASSRDWFDAAVVAFAFWAILARNTAGLPGVAMPYLDSGLATVSLVAQWMMTRKMLENWILWILVDLVYIPVYVYKGLPLTAALYAVFLALASLGLHAWWRSYRVVRVAELTSGTGR